MNIGNVDAAATSSGYVNVIQAVINNNGSFFNDKYLSKTASGFERKSTPSFGGYSPNTLQSRVIQLLHELGHIVVQNGSRLLPVDGGNIPLSEKNTEEVKKACKDQIDALKEQK